MTLSTGIEVPTELETLYTRTEKGIAWLTEHDPTGAFHLWFTSGLSPLSPMPAQSAERQADWVAYHAARMVFERLWRKMVALEKKQPALTSEAHRGPETPEDTSDPFGIHSHERYGGPEAHRG